VETPIGDVDVKVSAGGLGGVIAALPEDQRKVIGAMVVMACVFAVYFGFMWAVTHVFAPSEDKKCWELQSHANRLFKVNVCNGKVVELDKTSLQPKG